MGTYRPVTAGPIAGDGWKLSGALTSEPVLSCTGSDAGSSTVAILASLSSALTPYMAVSSISSAPDPKCSQSDENAKVDPFVFGEGLGATGFGLV